RIILKHQRDDDIVLCLAIDKRFRNHAYHRVGVSVQSNRFSDNRWVTAVMPRPESMTEYDGARTSRLRILGREHAPERCLSADGFEKVSRSLHPRDPLRRFLPAKIGVPIGQRSHLRKRAVPFLKIKELGNRD